VTVTIEGMDKLEAAFRQAPKIFVTVFDRAIKQATLSLLGRVREVTPVDTGFLRNTGMETSFETLIGRVDNVAPYAVYVHEGTLHMQARPFFTMGLASGQEAVNVYFEQALQEFANRI